MSNIDVYLFTAGLLAIVVGLIHSILGERLIFSRMRRHGLVPTYGKPVLKQRHVRILWASWHIVTIFGWGFAATLLKLAGSDGAGLSNQFIMINVIVCMLIASGLVLFATKGRHPGWVGLLMVAALCGFA